MRMLGALRRDSLVRNSSAMMATTAVNSGLGYVFWVLTARLVPGRDVGVVSALSAGMMLAATVACVGFGAALIARLPKRRTAAEWSLSVSGTLLATVLSSAAIGLLGAALLPMLVAAVRGTHPLALLQLEFAAGVVGWALTLVLDLIFVAERASYMMLWRNAGFAVCRLVLLGAAVALLPMRALTVYGVWVLAAWLSVFVAVRRALPALRPGFALSGAAIGREMRAMAGLLAGHHAVTVASQLPALLLPLLVTSRVGAAAGGRFYIGWMTGSVFFVVSPAVAASVFAEGAHSERDLMPAVRRASVLIAVLLVAPSLVVLVAGRTILSLFGAGYATAMPLLVPLVISAVPDAITNIAVSVLRVRGRLVAAAAINGTMAAVALIGAWLLVKPEGIAAVGWAWLAAQTLGALAVAVAVISRRLVGRRLAPPVWLWRGHAAREGGR
jgi:O-antigen/teichoic acid export membrane protein